MPDDVVLDYGTVAHPQPDGGVILEDEQHLFTLTKEALAALRHMAPPGTRADPDAKGPVPKAYELRGRFTTNGPVAYIQDEAGARYEIARLLEELRGRKVWILVEPEVG